MKKKVIAFIAVFIIITLTVVFINKGKEPQTEIVKTTMVEKGDIQTWLSTNALIKSKNIKEYYGTAGLTVDKVYIEVGDRVKKGDLLLEYDVTDMVNAVEQARIQYENAIINKADLVRQNEKIEEDIADMDAEMLKLDGSSNPQDITRLQSLIQQREAMQTISEEKFKLMDNSIALAKLGLDSAITRLNKVKDGLVADMDGVVTALTAKEDTSISPASPAVTLQDLDNLKGVISLGKYDAAKIKLGQICQIKNAGKVYDGTLSFISPAASKAMTMAGQDASLEAEIDIRNADTGLKIDFEASVDILTGEVTDVLKLPVECIKYDKDDNSFVFVVKEDKANLVPVKLGLQSDTEVEISEGVSEGDKVVLNPNMNLEDGMVVMEEGAVK